VVGVGEVLHEVADAGGDLVAEVGAEVVIPDGVEVLDVRGNGLEVLRQVRADEDAAGSIGVALAEVPAPRQVAFVTEVVIEVGDGVVAVTGLRRGAGVVAGLGGKAGDLSRIPQGAEDVLRDLARLDVVFGELSENFCSS
jgi:hypothetical protein